ncbi:MAG: D-glycero-beta-D-manno-heptose 1,7-bisphosphate 7-phosphatase [Pseudomonadota bacterium]
MSAQRWLILDRDGVINEDSDDFVRSPEEWIPIPGSIDAIAGLAQQGWHISVATNQSGIGRGYFPRSAVYAMHRKMRRLVRAQGGEVHDVVFCPHRPDEGCECRKPRPGMFRQLQRRTGLDLQQAHVVGDSLRDLEAGQSIGAKLWLVLTGKGQRTAQSVKARMPDWWSSVQVRNNLAEVARELGR